jgi:hypothetical protein
MASPSADAATLDPQMRLLLAELDKRFTRFDAKWNDRVAALEKRADGIDAGFDSMINNVGADVYNQLVDFDTAATDRAAAYEAAMTTRVAAIESAAGVFAAWQPLIETTISDVSAALDSMRVEISKISESSAQPKDASPNVRGARWSASGRPPASDEQADGPFGHRVGTSRRESGYGCVYTQTQLLLNGTQDHAPPKFSPTMGSPLDRWTGS